jgi:hypothetical protein
MLVPQWYEVKAWLAFPYFREIKVDVKYVWGGQAILNYTQS